LQVRAIDVIRRVSGSGLIMTSTEADLDHAEIGPVVERFLQGRALGGRDRVQLFKLAWDMVGEPFGSRQMLYEWFYAGDSEVNRIRFGSTPEVERYKQMVEARLNCCTDPDRDSRSFLRGFDLRAIKHHISPSSELNS
jgi:aromatic ring hydroxylase